MSERISVDIQDGVADVRLTRSDKMNALDDQMFKALIETGQRMKTEKGIRAVVLSGEGRAFCAGLDMGNFGKMAKSNDDSGSKSNKKRNALAPRTHGVANRAQYAAWVWREVPVPVIAAVHGVAFSGGFQVCLGADIRYVAPDTKMSIMEIKWGLVPDMSITQTLRDIMPMDVAKELQLPVDCTDFEQMNKVFKKQKNIDAVIHFAAFKSVEESVRQPDKYFSNNIGSLETLINLMNSHNVNNIIFSSSCTVYGTPEFLPVNELAPFGKAESPYGETKQLCEKLIEDSEINSISLRYFNPVGSHPTSLIGDCSADKPNNLVPIICEVASGKRESMQIFGNDYNTIDGTCVRDYIHVVDLAKAHVMAVNHILNRTKIKTAYNLGVGKGVSVQEVIDSFQKVNNLEISYELGPRRAGDVEKIYSDNTKINDELGWFPVMSFESALVTAWNWEKLQNL